MENTIVAISTAMGNGGIGIVRMSGEKSFEILEKIFIPKNKDAFVKGYQIKYGNIVDPRNEEIIDEVLVSYFVAPKSYTTENMCEINTHGGMVVEKRILELCLENGAEIAGPGEFTKRAFLNGRIDLSQAEAIIDLINSKTIREARESINQLEGHLSSKIESIRQKMLDLMIVIDVNIDYPEYDDVHQLTEEEILPRAEKWIDDIHQIIVTAQQSAVIKEGINTVILGRPNVGKSSLLNALLEEDKAIVTDVAGTTRDLVEGTVRLSGITLNLIDTAGIRKSDDAIEQIGITKSLQALEKAQLVIVVLDGSEELTEEDQELLEKTKNYNRIVVYNKKDKDSVHAGISISAIQKDITELTNAIVEKYQSEYIAANSDTLNNERQIGYALQAEQAMREAINALHAGMELDLVTIDLEKAWTALRQITGKAGKEDLLDEIFSRFCLGK